MGEVYVFVGSAVWVCAHVCRGQRTGSWALLQETFELFVWDSLIGVELHCVSRLVSELRGSACVCLSSSLCRDHKPVPPHTSLCTLVLSMKFGSSYLQGKALLTELPPQPLTRFSLTDRMENLLQSFNSEGIDNRTLLLDWDCKKCSVKRRWHKHFCFISFTWTLQIKIPQMSSPVSKVISHRILTSYYWNGRGKNQC